jgi:hypothetical protein
MAPRPVPDPPQDKPPGATRKRAITQAIAVSFLLTLFISLYFRFNPVVDVSPSATGIALIAFVTFLLAFGVDALIRALRRKP